MAQPMSEESIAALFGKSPTPFLPLGELPFLVLYLRNWLQKPYAYLSEGASGYRKCVAR